MSDETPKGRPYLFPIPGRMLRRLLDLKAEQVASGSGAGFTDDEAAADLMLDLDLIAYYGRAARDTGLLHAYRYYADRWGWPKTRVEEAWAGKPERVRRSRSGGERVVAAVEPWIGDRIASWRAFYGAGPGDGGGALGGGGVPRSANHAPRSANQKPASVPRKTQGANHAPDSANHAPDKQEQTYRPTEERERSPRAGAHARGDRQRGGPFEHPAVLEYERIVGKQVALEHARVIARAVPDDAGAVGRFAAIVVTWRDTPHWNERNVPDLCKHFARHERETAGSPDGSPEPGTRADVGDGPPPEGGRGRAVGRARGAPERHGPPPRRAPGGAGPVRGTAAERATVRTARANLALLDEFRRAHPERYGESADASGDAGGDDPPEGAADAGDAGEGDAPGHGAGL